MYDFILWSVICLNDVIIIGAGPAGLTAALYVARAGLSVLVFEKNIYGGQIALTNEVENYPAIEHITGAEFSTNLYNQVIKQNVEVLFEEVESVDFSGKIKKVFTNLGEHEAKTVIIANGVKRRKLGCSGEEEFAGRGVSYCATCDGAFFKEKDVAIVGGGNSALEEALFLSNICKSVTVLVRKDKVRAEQFLLKAANAKGNIRFMYNTVAIEVGGENESVSFVSVKNTISNKEKKLNASAVFIAIGLEPENAIFSDFIKLDANGYIIAGESCMTNVSGVFAAGDTRTKALRQIVTAASDGAIAAQNVIEKISTK